MRDRRTLLVVVAALPWTVWAVVRLSGVRLGHPAPALLAFTPFVFATAWMPAVFALALRRPLVATLALLPGLGLAAAVLPRAFAGPRPAPPGGPSLTVMSANLRYGNADPRRVVALVRRNRVKVLSLTELTPQALDRLDAAGLRAALPHRVADLRPGARGTALVSAYPLMDATRSSGARSAQPAASTRVPGGPTLRLQTAHPPPPISAVGVRDWRADLAGLPAAGRSRLLTLILGDFNATLDNAELRAVVDRGFVDAADATGDGLRLTFPVGEPLPPRVTIDHVLVDRRASPRRTWLADIPHSDHRAILTTIALPRRSP